MTNWPPSPSVEDESTALAKEHCLSHRTSELSNEQSIPCRGSMDQMPVILDSASDEPVPAPDCVQPTSKCSESKGASPPTTSTGFHNNNGLPTPPASDSEVSRGRSHPHDQTKSRGSPFEQHTTIRSRSSASIKEDTSSRPSISRLQTDLLDKSTRLQSKSRRAPSPYAYTPQQGTFRVDSASLTTTERIPQRSTGTPSPVLLTTERHGKLDPISHYQRRYEVSPDRGPLKDITSFAHKLHKSDKSESDCDTPKSQSQNASFKQPTNHIQHGHQRAHDFNTFPPRPPSRSRESPYSSSAEDSTVSNRHGSTRKSSLRRESVRHHSSHKPEPVQVESSSDHISSPRHKSNSSDDDTAARHIYRVSRGVNLMTPPVVTMPHQVEDYFHKAFAENDKKKSRGISRLSADENLLYSPPTSPPRTPKGEQAGNREYFASPLSSPQRTPRHSRAPSIDNTSIREPRTHPSLLSQATITAAALATKTSPALSKAASNAIETTFACSINALPSKPRSRPSSPHRERLQRSDTFTYGEHIMPPVTYPVVPQSKRPSTRDGLPGVEVARTQAVVQPQRTTSWSGKGIQYATHGIQSSVTSPLASAMNASPPRRPTIPQMYRSFSASTTQDVAQQYGGFSISPCPRSLPQQGLRDWFVIRDIPDLSICPNCAEALSLTRYRNLLLKGRDKPYDQLTACALSRPWLRQAIIQCVKLNKPDLAMLRRVSVLPEGARACEGSRPDVRTWWKLIDPSTERAVPDFSACSACVGTVHQLFPDLPDSFKRDVLNQEKTCGLNEWSRDFSTLIERLDQVATKCRERGKSSARYMQPVADHVTCLARYGECPRDNLQPKLVWHYANDLPEFTVCEACYHEVVRPVEYQQFAREISKILKVLPKATSKSTLLQGNTASNVASLNSCQLYSVRMRRLFEDLISGRLAYENFKTKVRDRTTVQRRLADMNRLYEEDQKMGYDRKADIEKNRSYWKTLE